MEGTILANRYLVNEEIGAGGMGSVYRATDLRTGGQVAVKVPYALFARSAEFVARLEREAQIAASIASRRVVRVLDLDRHNDVPFIVMEYVPGDTLADVIRERGRFTIAETLTVGLEVARALDAAYAKRIVHRDLKPQNIKLVNGEVKVLDFGIAKGEGFTNLTAASMFVGTPEYCAPERVTGPGDIRSDIYSLGIIMFQLYEGDLPFTATNPFAVMRMHEMQPPPPLSGTAPDPVRRLVARCLAKDPADRFETPHDLIEALRMVLDSPSGALLVPAPPDGDRPVVAQPRLTDSDATPIPAATLATEPAPLATVAAPALPAPPGGRSVLFIVVIAAAVVGVLGAVAAISLITRGGGEDSSTAGQDTSGTAAAPLLAPNDEQPLNGGQTFTLCPGVSTNLALRSIRAEPTGRTVVAYTVETPTVPGVDVCDVNHAIDSDCNCVALETRDATGRVTEARNTGAGGVAASGATNMYGAGQFSGEWWFDRDVDLRGDELTLVRYPPGGEAPLYRIPLLRR